MAKGQEKTDKLSSHTEFYGKLTNVVVTKSFTDLQMIEQVDGDPTEEQVTHYECKHTGKKGGTY